MQIGNDIRVERDIEGQTQVFFEDQIVSTNDYRHIMAALYTPTSATIRLLSSDDLLDLYSEEKDLEGTIHFFCPIWKNAFYRKLNNLSIPTSCYEQWANPNFSDTGHCGALVIDPGTVYERSSDFVRQFDPNGGVWRNAILLREDRTIFSAYVYHTRVRWMYLTNTVKELGTIRDDD